MTKRELKHLIREEIKNINEGKYDQFNYNDIKIGFKVTYIIPGTSYNMASGIVVDKMSTNTENIIVIKDKYNRKKSITMSHISSIEQNFNYSKNRKKLNQRPMSDINNEKTKLKQMIREELLKQTSYNISKSKVERILFDGAKIFKSLKSQHIIETLQKRYNVDLSGQFLKMDNLYISFQVGHLSVQIFTNKEQNPKFDGYIIFLNWDVHGWTISVSTGLSNKWAKL